MSSKPRLGYAVLDRETRLHTPLRYLPIVIVPDLMGTRLSNPAGGLAWNPLGLPIGEGPGSFTVDYHRLTQISAELAPDETTKFDDAAKHNEVKQIRHFYSLVPDLYGKLAKALASAQTFDEKIRPQVYCAGYDWRQDNARSALRLAEVVEEALAETRERKVILIAHGMGGHVCRYYCRVLGGESKVLQLFLVGSPTLGAPTAYVQLKNGVTGLYIKDIKDDLMTGDTTGAALELLQAGGNLFNMAAALTTGVGAGDKMKGASKSFFGDLYGLLCLGAGRFLSRKETTYFVRQLPSIYQLMPGSIYCKDNRNWVMFDPFATGHPPTGFMLVLPTLFDAALEVLGTALKDEVLGALAPEKAERTSGRAKRNMKTLADTLASIGEGMQHTPFEEDKPDKDIIGAITEIKEIFDRVGRSFVDCVNPGRFYNDIYTGLLDVVELRALCAGNLALAYRFDRAITVRPRDEAAESPLDTLSKIMAPALAALKIDVAEPLEVFTKALFSKSKRPLSERRAQEQEKLDLKKEEDKKKEKAEKDERERTKPRAYVHPSTVNIYGSSHQVEAGCVLLPTTVISNDDSNVVRWLMIPNFIALSMFFLKFAESTMSAFQASAMGDGTVPLRSANPGADSLSRALIANHEVTGVFHAELMRHEAVVDTHLIPAVKKLVVAFYKT